MRWVSTEVLPVPAPATTSMGPCTWSIASRCRSSGINTTGREFDFEDGIRGQHTTCDLRKNPASRFPVTVQFESNIEIIAGVIERSHFSGVVKDLACGAITFRR